MTKKPILLILAAGMGSRYGGLKQMDAVGPSGEAIIEYSIYDAINAGFGKIVFIIQKGMTSDFLERFEKMLNGKIDYEFVYQETDALPGGYTPPKDRIKPWGTGHAIWCARHMIDAPFAVINADDFYSRSAYDVLAKALVAPENKYYMVAYSLKNTLSEYGHVSRGVCTVDHNNNLTSVVEHTHISSKDGGIVFNDGETEKSLAEDSQVSMNFWGFNPDFFEHVESCFLDFLSKQNDSITGEFYIPTVVNHLIKNNIQKISLLQSDANWFGITYKDDKEFVKQCVNDLVKQNIYPEDLWK